MPKNLRIMAALTLLLAFALTPTVIRSAAIEGMVTDQTDGAGLYSATVTARSADKEMKPRVVASDDAGRYKITELLAGNYTVTVSFVGYSPKTFQVQVSDEGVAVVDARLSPSLIDLQSISVTASRQQEKILEAPAAVNVVSEEAVETRATLTPTEHVKGMPAVDIATTGLNQSNVVVRGFNNIFSGALLVLTDNRIARVPSLRFNAYNFIPVSNDDIERIEVVSGPGSALYGPNAATGVMHLITKSPFTSQGTTVSIAGGERELALGSFRHAGVTSNHRIGYKITGQYYQGKDWPSFDSQEPGMIRKYRPTTSGPVYVGDSIQNIRDYDIKKLGGTGRVDFLLNDNTSLILNGGFNRNDGIELTGLGAGQAVDWTYWYAQARLKHKDLFMQGFINASDAGDTYLLRTGQLIVDQSKLLGGQLQHQYKPNEQLSLTYGVDALFTIPETDGTINGINEDDDNITEFGVYFQGDYKLNEQWRAVGALRYDDHNRLEDPNWSPRAAITFQPNNNHNFRATFNRAFQTPDNNTLYLDILQAQDPFGVGAGFAPVLGFSPDIDIRVQGIPETGFHWSYDDTGNPQFRSPFAPLAGLTTDDYINMNDPLFTNVMWGVGRGAVLNGLTQTLSGAGVHPDTVALIAGAVNGVVPATVSGVNNTMMRLNQDELAFEPVTASDIADIERAKPTITQTFEFGYKGIISDRLRFAADVYATKKFDFIGPLTVETPNVFLDPGTLQATLGTDIGTAYAGATPETQAMLDQLDAAQYGGNGNGTPVDELTAMFTSGAAQIPFGTVTPEEALDGTALLVTYRNFGEITFWGADFAFDYHINKNFDIGGSYSYISKNFFGKDAEQVHDVVLNAPRNKFGVHARYTNQQLGLTVAPRFRWVEAFPMYGPFVGTEVEQYEVVDLNIDWKFVYNTRASLTVQNLLDNKHSEFVGAPAIGRLAILRLTQTF